MPVPTAARAFRLIHAGDAGRMYGLGVETSTGVLTVWLDPYSGQPVFGCFASAQDAASQLGNKLGQCGPLELMMNEREQEPQLAERYDEMVLTKAATRRPADWT